MATLHDTAKGTNDASGTALATADTLAVTAGDLIVLLPKAEGATTTITGSDGSNSYANAAATFEHSNSDLMGSILYAVAAATGSISPQANYGASRPFRMVKAYSITPAAGKVWTVGASSSAQGSASSAFNAGTLSATGAGVAVVTAPLYGARNLTAGAGWSIPAEFSSSEALDSEYRILTGAGSITGDGTLSSTVDWIGLMAIFYETDPVGGGGGSTIINLMLREAIEAWKKRRIWAHEWAPGAAVAA